MTTATQFLAENSGKPYTTWEKAVVAMVQAGSVIRWPLQPVNVQDGPHSGVIMVSTDYLAVGEPSDWIHIPLTPTTGQVVADMLGMVISTPKLVKATWEQAPVKLTPVAAPGLPSAQQNLGFGRSATPGCDASCWAARALAQIAEHSRFVQGQMRAAGVPQGTPVIVSGQKKDVVLSSIMKPGVVVIYGWFWPNRVGLPCNIQGTGQPQQCLSNVHGDFYGDYSHGFRYVAPIMSYDGQSADIRDVLADPKRAKILNAEGVCPVRYPTPYAPKPASGKTAGMADLGLTVARERQGGT